MKKVILILMLFTAPALAVEPDEILADPVLEARARDISKELRCLVCRNENIDTSNAGIARDLRLLVRERLSAGDSDRQATDFIVARYGEFVLLKPRFSPANAVLWAIGPLALLIGAALAIRFVRRRPVAPVKALSEQERKRLDAVLRD